MCFVKVGLEELEYAAHSPDINPTEHRLDELEHRRYPRHSHPTSVPDITNAFVETQTHTAMLQTLVKSHLRRVEHNVKKATISSM